MQKLEQIKQLLKENNINYILNEYMKNHTTFKIGGMATIYCEIENIQTICTIINYCNKEQIKYYLLGNGSNIIFSDKGYDGIIIKIICKDIYVENNTIIAQSGASLSDLCKFAQAQGLGGLEFAYGIPGTVGGAIYMNAGAYGGEIKDVVSEVTYINNSGKLKTYIKDELNFEYRKSIFTKTNECITNAKFVLVEKDKNEIKNKMEDLLKQRNSKQPLDMPSAGSTFKRPVGAFAGKLIEDCNLKGYTVGDAQISTKHSGFVVNIGNATCEDVIDLTNDVKKIVKEKTGFTLDREIKIIE